MWTGLHIFEVYEYEKALGYCQETGKKLPIKVKRAKRVKGGECDKFKGRRRDSVTRARTEFRRLVNANFTGGDYFVTVTTRDCITDVGAFMASWKKYVKRLKLAYGPLLYVGVVEFQRRGALHLHVMMRFVEGLPSEHRMGEIWGMGWVDVRVIDERAGKSVDNVGAYMSKYMSKAMSDPRLVGKKAYFTSRGLQRPYVFGGHDALQLLDTALASAAAVYSTEWAGEYTGRVRYREINLQRQQEIAAALQNNQQSAIIGQEVIQ